MPPYTQQLKNIAMLLVTLILVSMTPSMTSPFPSGDQTWMEYKLKYGKVHSKEEDPWRREIWVENSRNVQLHNSYYEESGYTQEVNMFSDMTSDEFKAKYCEHIPANYDTPDINIDINVSRRNSSNKLPGSVDWRKKGAVSPVKNSGYFVSSGTISALEALEGQWFLKSGHLVTLSVQQVSDCCIDCRAGEGAVWHYIMKAGGIEAAADYHGDRSHKCKFDPKKVAVKVLGYKTVSKTEPALQEALANVGPITVGINAGRRSFLSYRSGIYYDPQCTSSGINHLVLVVGYGSQGGRDYWLVKNSWGTMWGNKGYIKMARNRGNMCGIASMAAYPLV